MREEKTLNEADLKINLLDEKGLLTVMPQCLKWGICQKSERTTKLSTRLSDHQESKSIKL